MNRVGLTITNYGFFGNNFNSRSPSFEFPLGSALELHVAGRAVVGARALSDTGRFTGVSAAIVDNSAGLERPRRDRVHPGRQRLRRALARSQQRLLLAERDLGSGPDLAVRGSCRRACRRDSRPSTHRPLQIGVVQRLLGFSLAAADAFEVAQLHHREPRAAARQRVRRLSTRSSRAATRTRTQDGRRRIGTAGRDPGTTRLIIDYDRTRRFYQGALLRAGAVSGGVQLRLLPALGRVEAARRASRLGREQDRVVPLVVLSRRATLPATTDVERYGLMSNGGIDDVSGLRAGQPAVLADHGARGRSVRADRSGRQRARRLRVHRRRDRDGVQPARRLRAVRLRRRLPAARAAAVAAARGRAARLAARRLLGRIAGGGRGSDQRRTRTSRLRGLPRLRRPRSLSPETSWPSSI